jgi:hypothetical protein
MGYDEIAAAAHELFVSEPLHGQPVHPVCPHYDNLSGSPSRLG